MKLSDILICRILAKIEPGNIRNRYKNKSKILRKIYDIRSKISKKLIKTILKLIKKGY